MATFPIALADQGLYGGHNLARLPPEYLLKAENIEFSDGCIRKEGGAAIYNQELPAAFAEQTNPQNFGINGLAWNGALLVGVGAADGTDSYIITSPTGVTWTERAPTVAKNIALNAVCWSSTLLLFIAVGAADGTDAYILTSPDGITWTERANPKNFALNSIADYNGRLVAVGAADGTDAYVITSPDGINWTEQTNPKNFALNEVALGGGSTNPRFVAVGGADGTDAYLVSRIASGGTGAGTWALQGSGLSIAGIGNIAIAALTSTDVAYIDSTNDQLRTYRWNGSIWAQVGSGLTISGITTPGLAALSSTDVALAATGLGELRTYRWSGSTWSLVGSGLAITGMGVPRLDALNSTDIAFWDGTTIDEIRTYRFSGSTWAQVGNALAVGGATNGAITALSSTDIAFIDSGNDELRTYRWDGSDWSQVGSGLAIAGLALGNQGIAAINSTDIAFHDSDNDELRLYRWSGSAWALVGTGLALVGSGASLAWLTGVDVAFIDTTNEELRTYRFDDPWVEQANPKNIALNSIVWDGDSYAAVGAADGTDSYILTSTDNITWTERAPTVAKNLGLNSVAWSGSMYMAVGVADGTDGYLLTSLDGITWTEWSNPKNFALNSVVWNGDYFVLAGAADGTDAYILISSSLAAAATWAERTNPKNFTLEDVVFNGQIYVAVGRADGTDAYIATSTDLATWTERTNAENTRLNAVIWTGSRFVAVGALSAVQAYAYILNSNDGITWTQRTNPKNFGLNDLAYNGVVMVAVGNADGTDAYIITSQDGKNWTEQENPKNFNLNSIVWDGDQFIAVGMNDGADSYIVTSPDGVTWTERASANDEELYGIAWNGSLLVAVGASDGSDAFIATSPDGITWTERTNPGAVDLFDVTWNGKIFIAVGTADGTDAYIVTSSDGITWAEQSNPKNFGLNAVIWDGVYFVAAGSADGTDAYLITLDYDQNYVLGAAYWNYDGSTPKIVALDLSGRFLMDNFDGNFSTILDTGHTVTTATFPVFVEGGKEVAANNKKLFAFTGSNPVQVLSGSGTTTADIATPPADWAAANQPTGGLIHKNRLWGYGNANDPHRLYYTGTASHEDFSAGGSLSIYPGEGEKIVNAISYKGYIIVFKYPKGIYVVDTTPVQTAAWSVDRVNEKLGGAGQGSAAVVEEDVVFIDHTGEIRLIAGITEFGDIGSKSFSDMHDISVFIRDNYYLPSNTKWRMAYYSKKRELHIAASSNYLGVNDNRMVVDFNRQNPRFRNSTRDTCLYLFLRELNGVPELMACDNLGYIWRMDQATKAKNGQGYNSQFQLTYTDLGFPGVDKGGQFLSIDFEPTDTEAAIDVIWDGSYQETTTIDLSAELEVQPGRLVLTKNVPLNGSGDRLSLTFRNNNAGEDYAIQGLRILHTGGSEEKEP